MKTQYRTKSDGYCTWLQFRTKMWGIFPVWSYIKRAYIDEITGSSCDMMGWDNTINGYNTNLDKFVEKYPDISDYWPVYRKQKQEIIKRHNENWKERMQKKKEKKYY